MSFQDHKKWSICPKCWSGTDEQKQYNHMAVDAVEQRSAILRAFPHNMEEFIEYGMDERGVLQILYCCGCQKCGFHWHGQFQARTGGAES